MLIHTGNHFPSGSISPRSFVTKVMTHLRHTSLLLQWELAFSFPRMLQQSSRHKFIFTTDFWVKRRCFVFLFPLAVKVLFCMGDLMLAFCSVEVFLRVCMIDFNSFRRGEFKVVRSLVSEESYEKLSLRSFGQLQSASLVSRLCYWRVLIRTVNDVEKNSYLSDLPLLLFVC